MTAGPHLACLLLHLCHLKQCLAHRNWSESRSVMSDSLWPHGLYNPWNSPGQNTGVGSHSFLQGIFPTQESNPGLPHCGRILFQLSHQGSPAHIEWMNESVNGYMNKQLLVFPGYIETNCCTFYFLFLTSTFCFDSPWSFFVCLFWFNSRHWSFLFFKFSSTERFRVVGIKMLVAPSCSTLCNPMDSNLPGSSVHGIFQARILEWVAFPFSRESSQPRDQTQVSCIAGGFFTYWTTREALVHIWSPANH